MNDALTATSALAPESSEPPMILAEGIDYFYGEGEFQKQALFANDLEILPGEVVILTGPSGCGKTTLLTLIGGLRRVQRGRLTVFGRSLEKLSNVELASIRRDIGFIFQAHNLFDSLTALENVRMALELEPLSRREMDDRCKEILERLGLGDRIDYKPGRLSGGQRQRVAIARALVRRPRLVLADEPTAALDEKSGDIVMQLLKETAKRQRSSVLVVTHDQRVLRAADRIVSMNFGRIVSNVLKEESTIMCEFLARVDTFKALPPATLAGIADKMSRERYRAGTVLFRQDDPGEKFYVLRRGEVEVRRVDGAEDSFVKILREGDYFGEIALLKDVPRTATATARTDVELYSLGKTDFRLAVEGSDSLREQIWKVYFQRQ